MARRKKASKKPTEKRMGFSGVHEDELNEVVAELKKNGATEIVITDDEQTGIDCPPGPYHFVDYKKVI